MTRFLPLLLLTLPSTAAPPKPLVEGLKSPVCPCVGPDGRIYVSCWEGSHKPDSGSIVVIKDGKATPFCTGLKGSRFIVAFQQWFFVTSDDGVLRIDRNGKATVLAGPKA